MPKTEVVKLRNIFLSISVSKEGVKALKFINQQATGLVSVADSDYDNLRKIMKHIDVLHRH